MDVNELLEERVGEIVTELTPDIVELSEQLSIPTNVLSFMVGQLAETVIAADDPADLVRYALSKSFDRRKPILVENDETGSRRWAVINEQVPLNAEPLIEEAQHHAHVVFERGEWGNREFVHRLISARDRGLNFDRKISTRQIEEHPLTKEAVKRGWHVAKIFYAKHKEDPEPNEAAKEHIRYGKLDDAKMRNHK